MNELFIVAVFTYETGGYNIDTVICADMAEASVKLFEEYNYAQNKAPRDEDDIYYYQSEYFEIGDYSKNYWVRGEIQRKSINN